MFLRPEEASVSPRPWKHSPDGAYALNPPRFSPRQRPDVAMLDVERILRRPALDHLRAQLVVTEGLELSERFFGGHTRRTK